jgi:hypothetical protein
MTLSLDQMKEDRGFEPSEANVIEHQDELKTCPFCGLLFVSLAHHRPGKSRLCRLSCGEMTIGEYYRTKGGHKKIGKAAPMTPPPLCGCGCGEYVRGHQKGVWSQWLPGHTARLRVVYS